ncbi:MAG: hypothetical protein KAU01_04875 [Candidatus Cloacimonetes bacterium]|nr:hypothetical protein [Candidatus Cloacimonadota bacterium]
MKRILIFCFLLLCYFLLYSNTVPVVSNVTAQQRGDGSFMVDIYYDVYDADGDALTITMQVSPDNGLTWTFSCTQISGDVGPNIYNGNDKHIIWNLGTEHPNIAGNNFKFRVNAYDGVNVDPFSWSFVPAGDYTWGEYNQIQTIDYDYMIMTYEVTNAEYKQFLDEAFVMDSIWIAGDYVKGYYPGDQYTSAGEQIFYSL